METNDGIRIGKVVYSDDLSTVLSADKDITSFEIIRGVRCIGSRAFSGCRKLRVVRIPETVIRIEDYAFQDCTAIQELYMPYYIEYISPLAFTNSDESEPFYLCIPNVHIPKDAFRKYAYLIPEYISWFDCEHYGITSEELEEDEDFDYILGYPISIDEKEFCRMALINDLEELFCISQDIERDEDINDSDKDQIIAEMMDCALKECNFVQSEELVSSKDYPIIDNIEESFGCMLESSVKDHIFFGWPWNCPTDIIDKALSDSMKWGAILPLIWDEPDDPEMYRVNLFIYCTASYGDLTSYFQEQYLQTDSKINEWCNLFDRSYGKVMKTGLEQCNQRGYDISISLYQKLFHDCMRILFQIGFSYGLKCREKGDLLK